MADAPTRWGRVGFSITSQAAAGAITARLAFPKSGLRAETRLRLRAPNQMHLKSVELNGRAWTAVDAAAEVIVVPPGTGGAVEIVATLQPAPPVSPP